MQNLRRRRRMGSIDHHLNYYARVLLLIGLVMVNDIKGRVAILFEFEGCLIVFELFLNGSGAFGSRLVFGSVLW